MKKSNTIRLCFCMIIVAVYAAVFFVVKRNVMETAAVLQSPPIIIIDAGHGGEDGGAVSVTGIKESDLNLSIALRLEQTFALCGIPTKMIRTEDASIYTTGETITEKKVSDLKNRVQIVNHTPNAILLSIHQNHFSESKYSGAQVFYAPTKNSRELASLTQQNLRSHIDTSNHRQIKQAASVYLMEQITCPGILIECGFLSNPDENIRLQDPLYQTKLSCVIAASMIQYLEEGNHIEV